ncbi:response regulator [Paraferrimonas sp. SM1919]|uniref:response regulator n=1 Tax=Paraferrimonas sp. SM1919 TaxID=2662263 RepID=UPI0013D64A10|nr:response regulator [Paraferrimonas sp. SM1919]
MKLQILICDDSKLARKHTSNIINSLFDVDIFLAQNAEQAYAVLANQTIDVLLLDLNLPNISGFDILEFIKPRYPSLKIIVISADCQLKTKQKVAQLGAQLFLEKPIYSEDVFLAFKQLGINEPHQISAQTCPHAVTPDLIEASQELANIAMGNSASLFGLLYDRFVEIQSPSSYLSNLGQLTAQLSTFPKDEISAVCQSFIGSGLSGEAMLLFNINGFEEMATIMEISEQEHPEAEILVDLSNMLVGAFLAGFAELLACQLNQNNPVILGHHLCLAEIFENHRNSTEQHLVIEMNYRIPATSIDCKLLVVIGEHSIAVLENKLSKIKVWN